MKTFITACTIIAVIIAVTVLDTVFVTKTTNELITDIEDLPDSEETENISDQKLQAQVEKIQAMWNKKKKIVALTVNHSYVAATDLAFDNLSGFAISDEKADFETAKRAAILALQNIAQLEGKSFDTII